MEDTSGRTPLQIYRQLAKLRKHDSFLRGSMQYIVITDNVFSFVRHYKNQPAYLVAMNFGGVKSINDHAVIIGETIYKKGKLEVATSNVEAKPGAEIKLVSLNLEPSQGLVIKLESS